MIIDIEEEARAYVEAYRDHGGNYRCDLITGLLDLLDSLRTTPGADTAEIARRIEEYGDERVEEVKHFIWLRFGVRYEDAIRVQGNDK